MTAFGTRTSLIIGLFVIAAAANPALAAPPAAQKRAAVLQGLADCRKLTDGAERLACYDKAAALLDEAETKGDIVVADRAQVREVRRQAFGFILPSLNVFDHPGDKPEEADRLTAKVESAVQQGDGKWIIRLEGGQVWRQIDTDELTRYPKAGGTVTISRAMMGSYKLSTGGGSVIRVHRDE